MPGGNRVHVLQLLKPESARALVPQEKPLKEKPERRN